MKKKLKMLNERKFVTSWLGFHSYKLKLCVREYIKTSVSSIGQTCSLCDKVSDWLRSYQPPAPRQQQWSRNFQCEFATKARRDKKAKIDVTKSFFIPHSAISSPLRTSRIETLTHCVCSTYDSGPSPIIYISSFYFPGEFSLFSKFIR